MTIDETIDEVRRALDARDTAAVRALTDRADVPERVQIASRLTPGEGARLIGSWPVELARDVLANLDPAGAAAILREVGHDEAARLLGALEPDDATDVIHELPAVDAARILERMDHAEADELRELLAYPPDTAGGRMTPTFVAIAPDLRADQAIVALRQVAEEAETVNAVYVLDPRDTLLGVLSLHQLVLNSPETPVRALMAPEVIAVHADADQEEAARLLTERHLLALPVIDAEGRLLGIITQDDVADVLEAEATEDIERLGGSQPLEMPYRMASVPLLVRRRIVWLLALFIAEAYTGTVMRAFEGELSQVVALSFFVPLLIGTGGNIGSQVTTTLVRAMAVDELRLRDARWVLGKEIAVGLTMGAVMAVAALGRAEILGVGVDVGAVVALTIAAICLWSSAVAAILPLLLQKARVDPAVVSAPMITTLVDGTGLVIYFTVARMLLKR